MTRTSVRAAVAAAVTAALLPAAAAEAKAPPRGDYHCASSSYLLSLGNLKIVNRRTYTVNGKDKGRFTTRGRKIRFKSGAYRRAYRAKWRRVQGKPYIYLIGKRSGDELGTCTFQSR